MSEKKEEGGFPLLPKLKKENNVDSFKSAGVWDRRTAENLDKLSDSLDVPKIDPKYVDIGSIPDMWARPLLFEMALYDTNHPLHERILGEWRGLLAMLALKEWRNLTQLRVMPIQIPPDNQSTIDFLNALRKLIPSKTLSSDTPWDNLYVILFGNEPIGITSPTTLVCTAADYYNRIQKVTWFDGQFLNNPTLITTVEEADKDKKERLGEEKLNKQERKALADWLEQLKENLLGHQGLNQKMGEWEALSPLLKRFKEDLERNLGGVTAEPTAPSNKGLGMEKGIFSYLDKPIKPKEFPSHVLLKPSRENAPSPSLLVVDKKIPEQWNMPDYEVFVFGSTTIAFFDKTQLQADVREQLRSPENFFTEKLFIIAKPGAFPGAMSPHGVDNLQDKKGNSVTPIIPIKAELLNYLTVEDLCQRISFGRSNVGADNEGIVVELQLPLSGPDGSGKDFKIQREFCFQKGEVNSNAISDVPVLEVWPYFKASKWKAYYTYFSIAGREKTFYAKPHTPGYVLNEQQNVQTFNVSNVEHKITRMELFPESMICTAQEADTQGNRMITVPAGVLLLKQPKPLDPSTKSWTIGIDFGTTGTNVYVTDNSDNPPSPIDFNPRFLQVTQSGDERTQMYDYFLPGVPEPIPFFTCFHKFPTPGRRPLLDGHIYFLSDYQAASEKLKSEIITNLKWGGSNEHAYVQPFLEQLCLQCAAEAVANGVKDVGWRFSFPTAFSTQDRKDFQDIWNEITQACTNRTGLAQIHGSPKAEPESVVSARFFAECPEIPPDRTALFDSGVVCIDIGGGTSDISVWQRNKLCWQTSLLFAGQNLFLDLLYSRPDFLKNIFSVDVSSLEQFKNSHNRTAFYAQADALIKQNGESWLRSLRDARAVKEKSRQLKEFTQLMMIGLSGLFYYVGLLLQFLHQSSKYDDGRMPNVYVAGNGAKMFRWLEVGFDEFFKKVILKASGFQSDSFEVWISPAPKAEAAFGLVCRGVRLSYDEKAKYDILAGEGFMENGNRCDWSELLTTGRLTKGLKALPTLEKLEDFVQTFNNYAKSPGAATIELNTTLRNRICDSLSDKLARFKGADEEVIHVEPLFIYALKILMEIKACEWTS